MIEAFSHALLRSIISKSAADYTEKIFNALLIEVRYEVLSPTDRYHFPFDIQSLIGLIIEFYGF